MFLMYDRTLLRRSASLASMSHSENFMISLSYGKLSEKMTTDLCVVLERIGRLRQT